MGSDRRRCRRAWLELAATWFLSAAFGVVVTAFHFIRTDLDPVRRGVSRYQWGEHGQAMSLAFAGLALAFSCAGRIVRRGRFAEARHVAALLHVSAAGAVVVAFVPLSDAPPFLDNVAHQLAGGVMFTASIVAMCMTPRRVAGPLASGIARATALAGGAFVLSVALRVPLSGLLQRVMLCGTCVWLVIGSWRAAQAAISTAHRATSLERT